MILSRSKLIEQFQETLLTTTTRYINISSRSVREREYFIELLESGDILSSSNTAKIQLNQDGTSEIIHENNEADTVLFYTPSLPDISHIRTIIELYQNEPRGIIISEQQMWDDEVTPFPLSGIGFREYAQSKWKKIQIQEIMESQTEIESINTLRDEYIHLGQWQENIENPEAITENFMNIFEIATQELFTKEKDDYMEYLRTIAMGVGDIFKWDRTAKNIGLSRRKIHKYTELSLKYNIIQAIGPLVLDNETELSRHVKLYFSDLSYIYAILGNSYYHWAMKQWVIENFLLLELERKLTKTHDIRFYRKKSGSEIAFVLENRANWLLTPIDVTIKRTIIEPKSFVYFHEKYKEKVETYMMANDSDIRQSTIWEKPFIILPHIAL